MIGPIFEEQAKGLYLLGAFGAKGTLVAPYAAEVLAAQLLGEAVPASKSHLENVAPGRFLKRLEKKARRSLL